MKWWGIYGFLFHSIIIVAVERRQQLSPLLKPLQTTGQNWFTFLLLLIFLRRCHLKSAPHVMDQWVIPRDSLNFPAWMLLPFLCCYPHTHTWYYFPTWLEQGFDDDVVDIILLLYWHWIWFLTRSNDSWKLKISAFLLRKTKCHLLYFSVIIQMKHFWLVIANQLMFIISTWAWFPWLLVVCRKSILSLFLL